MVTAVARKLDEVERMDERQRPREVAGEDDARLERRDQDGFAALEVGRDLGAELGDACLDLLGGEVDLSDPRVGAQETRSRRNLWARRSMSRL